MSPTAEIIWGGQDLDHDFVSNGMDKVYIRKYAIRGDV